MSLWIAVVLIVLVVTAGEVLGKRYEALGRRPEAPPASGGEEEMERLRERVESLAGRVDRLAEEQRFLTRLLEERPDPGRRTEGARTLGSSPGYPKSEEAV